MTTTCPTMTVGKIKQLTTTPSPKGVVYIEAEGMTVFRAIQNERERILTAMEPLFAHGLTREWEQVKAVVLNQ